MPNQCMNILQVQGNPDQVQAFREMAAGEKSALDINNFIPMPRELEDTTSPNRNESEAAELRSKYGAPNWYAWAQSNWGTKWGAYDITVEELTDNLLEYTFCTAWSPFSDAALQAISAKAPGVQLSLEYSEPGMMFKGRCLAQDGEILESDSGEMTHADCVAEGYIEEDELEDQSQAE